MPAYTYTKEAEEALARFLSVHPVVTHDVYRKQIDRSVEYFMLKEEASEVSKELLVKALEDRYPSNEPSTLVLKDPERLTDTIKRQQAVDRENPIVKIRRWSGGAAVSREPAKDVFAFLAHSRTDGNTDAVMDAVLEGAREGGGAVDKLCFSDLNLNPCTGCMGCQGKKLENHCVIQDDMPRVYKRFLECDAFVLGLPIYTGRENAQAAIFYDRLKALTDPWKKTPHKPRKGLLVCTWGWPSDHIYEGVVSQLATILFMFGVNVVEIVTGSGFWDAYYAKGSAALDPDGMQQAKDAGKALCA